MNRFQPFLYICAAFLSLALHLGAQEAVTTAQPTESAVATSEAQPVTESVPNPEISDEEFYGRTLIYSVGSQHLYQKLQALLLDSEIQRRSDAGVSMEYAKVNDLDVDNRIDQTVSDFLDKNPDLDFWVQVQSMGYDEDSYRSEVYRQIALERLFFPPNPEDWPMELLKEIFGGDAEGSLWTSMIEKMPASLIEKREKGEPYGMDPMTMQVFLRPSVFRWMMESAEIVYPFDGLKEGLCLTVNGMEVSTKDLVERISPVVSDVDEERAATWVELCKTLKADLASKDLLLTEEETQAIIDEEKKEYVNSYISYEQVVLEFQGFPTLEMFKQYKQLRMSFRQTVSYPLSDKVMAAHLEKRRQFIASGQVKAEAILFSAKDLDTGAWPKKGSFEAAKGRSELAVQALLDGKPFHQVLPQYSEYPEMTRGSQPSMPQPKRGRFGSQMRNPLRQFLGESEFTDFLTGVSIADDLFFDAEVGAVYGPREGSLGYYIYRLIHRSEPTTQVDFKDNERHAFFIKDDHLSMNFLEYIAGVMSR